MRSTTMRTLGVLLGGLVIVSGAAASLASQPATEPKKEEPKAQTPTQAPDAKDAPAKEQYVYVNLHIKQGDKSLGDIVLQLDEEKAPVSVKNFMQYVDKGYYDGTIFHRVIGNFMIQGGGFTPDLQQKKTDAPIKNEWKNGLKNQKYTVAMARTAVADSATSQFFINVQDNAFLDQPRDGAAYAVFGKVVAGFDVVDAIKGVKTGAKGPFASDVPAETVLIDKVSKLSDADAAKYKDAKTTK